MKFMDFKKIISKKINELEVLANISEDVINAIAAKKFILELEELLKFLEMDENDNDICLVSLFQFVAEKNYFIEKEGFFFKLAFVRDARKFNVYLAEPV